MIATTVRLPATLTEALDRFLQEKRAGTARWQETLAALQSVKGGRLVHGADVNVWLASWGNPVKQKTSR